MTNQLDSTKQEPTNDQGLTFDQWYRKADMAVARVCGLGLDDLADGPSWDCWEAGYAPAEYARERLEEEGFPFDD